MDFLFQNLFTSFSFNVIILLSGTLSSYCFVGFFFVVFFSFLCRWIYFPKQIKAISFFPLVFYICLEKGHYKYRSR